MAELEQCDNCGSPEGDWCPCGRIGETVYHPDYGRGATTVPVNPLFVAVDFEHGGHREFSPRHAQLARTAYPPKAMPKVAEPYRIPQSFGSSSASNGNSSSPPVPTWAPNAPTGGNGQMPELTPEQRAEIRRLLVEQEAERIRLRRDAQRLLNSEGAAEPTPFVSLAELLAAPDEPVAYRIDGLLPVGGRVILSAQRKSGKTTAVVNLVRNLADGTQFLDRHHVARPAGKVVLLDFEMTKAQLRGWLRDSGILAPERVEIRLLRGAASSFNICATEVRARWATELRALDCAVLVVDCLRPILDSIGLDENSEAGIFLVALDALLAEAGIGELILVHHSGHNGERSRGDSRLRDWPDAEWKIVRERPEREGEDPAIDCKRFFSAEGRDVAVFESELLFNPRTRHLSLQSGNRNDAKQEAQSEKLMADIMTCLQEKGECNQSVIFAECKPRNNQLGKAALDRLIERRLIRSRNGKGKEILYCLASQFASQPEVEL
jgi:hypothetical protein